MRMFIRSIFVWLGIGVLCVVSFNAQTGGKKDTHPFAIGEKLQYEGKVSKVIQGIEVADLTFNVRKQPDSENFVINAEAKSKGTLIKLFKFSFLQIFDSTIDGNDFKALRSIHHDVQKERVRDSEAVFDYKEQRVTYVETDPKDPNRPPRKIASKIDENTNDLISGLYSLRLLPLAIGKTFDLNVSDSGLVYEIPVKVTARERQKTIFGKVWCFRLEPDVFGPGRLIEKEGKMVIWVTDDARRIPVRGQIETFVKVDIRLKTATGLK
ncbi:MAG: DUF3108 domain-containing protein [Acidobacteriota bacterium]